MTNQQDHSNSFRSDFFELPPDNKIEGSCPEIKQSIDLNGSALNSEPFQLSPDLSALEARIGQFQPRIEKERLEKIKSTILMEQCRRLEKILTPETKRERLVETFERAEKEEVSLSLNQFLKSVRTTSTLTGGAVGFLLGVLFTFVGIFLTVHFLTPEFNSTRAETEKNPIYNFGSDQYDPIHFLGTGNFESSRPSKETIHDNK